MGGSTTPGGRWGWEVGGARMWGSTTPGGRWGWDVGPGGGWGWDVGQYYTWRWVGLGCGAVLHLEVGGAGMWGSTTPGGGWGWDVGAVLHLEVGGAGMWGSTTPGGGWGWDVGAVLHLEVGGAGMWGSTTLGGRWGWDVGQYYTWRWVGLRCGAALYTPGLGCGSLYCCCIICLQKQQFLGQWRGQRVYFSLDINRGFIIYDRSNLVREFELILCYAITMCCYQGSIYWGGGGEILPQKKFCQTMY